MPYRRLPNTDQARMRAMEKALRKCLTDNPANCPISEASLVSLQVLLPKFQHAIINLDAARRNQVQKNKDHIELLKKAKLYISHFIQVLNFSIARGELKPDVREFYSLPANRESLPQLISEKNILDWGKKLIEGEQKRLQRGGSPIYNPSIALVKVNFEKFADSYTFQKNLIAISNRGSKLVDSMRPEADALILQVWDEIEKYFMQDDGLTDREKAGEYGIVYIYRRREILEKEKQKAIESKPAIQKEEPKKYVYEKETEALNHRYSISMQHTPFQSTINF